MFPSTQYSTGNGPIGGSPLRASVLSPIDRNLSPSPPANCVGARRYANTAAAPAQEPQQPRAPPVSRKDSGPKPWLRNKVPNPSLGSNQSQLTPLREKKAGMAFEVPMDDATATQPKARPPWKKSEAFSVEVGNSNRNGARSFDDTPVGGAPNANNHHRGVGAQPLHGQRTPSGVTPVGPANRRPPFSFDDTPVGGSGGGAGAARSLPFDEQPIGGSTNNSRPWNSGTTTPGGTSTTGATRGGNGFAFDHAAERQTASYGSNGTNTRPYSSSRQQWNTDNTGTSCTRGYPSSTASSRSTYNTTRQPPVSRYGNSRTNTATAAREVEELMEMHERETVFMKEKHQEAVEQAEVKLQQVRHTAKEEKNVLLERIALLEGVIQRQQTELSGWEWLRCAGFRLVTFAILLPMLVVCYWVLSSVLFELFGIDMAASVDAACSMVKQTTAVLAAVLLVFVVDLTTSSSSMLRSLLSAWKAKRST